MWSATVVVPLAVSLIALGGVILTNLWTGRNMISAERVRAELAEQAADKRALEAIEAEDRRAQALIDAENLRHENELRRTTRDHLLDAIRELYVAVESRRRELIEASHSVLRFGLDAQLWRNQAGLERERFEEAVDGFASAMDGVALLGSEQVGKIARRVYFTAYRIQMTSENLTTDGRLQHIDPMYLGGFEEYVKLHDDLTEQCGELHNSMRFELHEDGNTPIP